MTTPRFLAAGLLAVAFTLTPLMPAPAQSLDTRRFLKEMQDKDVPEFQKKASDAAGTPITLDIDQGSFGDNKSALESMRFYLFPGLTAALATIAKDDLGKQALAQKIKKVHVVYDLKVNDQKGLSLKDGTLDVHYAFGGGSYLTESQYKAFLEQSL